jgi:WD40 repeat protein
MRHSTQFQRALLLLLIFSFDKCDDVQGADGPFTITSVDIDKFTADGAVASLGLSSDSLHAGTFLGETEIWNTLHLADKQRPGPESFLADPFAVLFLQDLERTLIVGGLSRRPSIRFLEGANIGYVGSVAGTDKKVHAVATHPRTGRTAILCEDAIIILNGPKAELEKTINGKFRFITWVDHIANNDREIRLSAYEWDSANQLSRIHTWKQEAQGWKETKVINLPNKKLPSGDSTQEPIEVTCLSSLTNDGKISTGDASGYYRIWNATAESRKFEKTTLPELVYISSDGKMLVEYHSNKLWFYDTSTGQEVRSKDNNDLVAIAWMNVDDEVSVEVFRPATKQSLLPQIQPESGIDVLAIRPDGKQAAGAVKGTKGITLFEESAPPSIETPNSIEEDDAICGLFYSDDGKWLLAVGSKVSLYNAQDHKLVAEEPLDSTSAITACDFCQKSIKFDQPMELVAGTEDGNIGIWNISVDVNAETVAIDALAKIDAADQRIEKISCFDNQFISISKSATTLWQINNTTENRFEQLELIEKNPVYDAALTQNNIVMRLKTAIHTVEPSAHMVHMVKNHSNEPVRFLANYESNVHVAATESGYLLPFFGETPGGAVDVGQRIVALSMDDIGKTLIAALEENEQANTRIKAWSVSDKLESKEPEITLKTSKVASLLVGNSDVACLATDDGKLYKFRLGTSQSLRRLPGTKSSGLNLSWTPGFDDAGKATGKNDFSNILVADGTDKLVVRALNGASGPYIKIPKESQNYHPAPWYACAFSPDGSSIALVNADGEICVSPWSLPRKLIGYKADNEHLQLNLIGISAPPYSASLYAVTWWKADSEEEPSIVAAGADGNLYVSKDHKSISTTTATPNSHQPIYALAASSRHSILVVGHGLNLPPQDKDRYLTVWTKSLDPSKSLTWNGHEHPVIVAAFSTDGTILASLDESGRVIFWDCSSLTNDNLSQPPSTTFQLAATPSAIAWHDRIQNQLVIGLKDKQVMFLQIEKNSATLSP